MKRIIAFSILSLVKILSWLFYKVDYKWLNTTKKNPWKNIRLMIFLNHTSLFEPLFLQIIPFHYLWHLAGHFNIPGADITLSRPLVGRLWKLMIPNISSITRKKDASWDNFMGSIKPHDVIMIAPEGRMKRPNGLDKFGRPMSIKGGVADIIDFLHEGEMLLCYSGGLHHVQSPGERFPRLFKTIKMNLESLDMKTYKENFKFDKRKRKLAIIEDLKERQNKSTPVS